MPRASTGSRPRMSSWRRAARPAPPSRRRLPQLASRWSWSATSKRSRASAMRCRRPAAQSSSLPRGPRPAKVQHDKFIMTKPSPAPEQMLVVERDAALAVVTMNRPRKLNAMGRGFWPELRQVLAELEADAALRCVIVTGAGDKAFSAGGDIASLAELGDVVDR